MTELGAVEPSYAFFFHRLPERAQKRLLNMLKAGVCTNVGELFPVYCTLARYANVPAMVMRKSKQYGWVVWTYRTAYCAQVAIRELQVGDRAAMTLLNPKFRYPTYAHFDDRTGKFSLFCQKDTAILRTLAKEQWADTPEYKARIKALVAKLQSGETIWFN